MASVKIKIEVSFDNAHKGFTNTRFEGKIVNLYSKYPLVQGVIEKRLGVSQNYRGDSVLFVPKLKYARISPRNYLMTHIIIDSFVDMEVHLEERG